MGYLQAELDRIEAEAIKKSAMAMAGAATIDAAMALRDRLLNEEEFEPLVTFHYHCDRLEISIHAPSNQDDMFRVALAGLDIEARHDKGYQDIGNNVSLMFQEQAHWAVVRAVA